jgi:hypothetical protein
MTTARHTRVVLWLMASAAGLMLAAAPDRLGAATDHRHRRLDVLGQLYRVARLPRRALRHNRDRPYGGALHLF